MLDESNIKKLVLGGNIFGCFTDSRQTSEIFSAARDFGVFSVDTADVYSKGLSEELVGQCIKHDRSRWFVASKVGLPSDGNPAGLARASDIRARLEKSLRRLGTEYIDLYQVHHFDPETPLDETIACLQEAISKGYIRQAGISNYSLSQLHSLLELPGHCISFCQTKVNVCNFWQMEPYLDLCLKNSIKVLAYSALARGLLSERFLQGEIPQGSRAAISANVRNDLNHDFITRLQRMYEVCLQNNVSIPHAALQFLVRQEGVAGVIVGVKSVSQLMDCVQGAGIAVSQNALSAICKIWQGCLH